MKSLLDIQQDIRKLEKDVQSVTDSIRNINSDIESIKNSSGEITLDFPRIEVLARQFPFDGHPISKLEEERKCRIYLEMLLNIVRLDSDKEITVNRMIFIQWLLMQSHVNWTLEELYRNSFRINMQLYTELTDEIQKKYREYLVVDALIVANIAGVANLEIYEYIANMALILTLSAEELKTLSMISKLVLCRNIEGLNREQSKAVESKIKEYSHYISADIADEIREKIRIIAVSLHDDDIRDFQWKVKQFQKVKSGDILAAYYQKNGGFHRRSLARERKMEEIKAEVSGTIFQFRDNNTNYGVISQEHDNKDTIKAWVKGRR